MEEHPWHIYGRLDIEYLENLRQTENIENFEYSRQTEKKDVVLHFNKRYVRGKMCCNMLIDNDLSFILSIVLLDIFNEGK